MTIKTICDNGSLPALALLERKMADPRLEDEDKVIWMRGPMLEHRHEILMLQSIGRMLNGGITPPLRPDLVDAVASYRRGEWYLACEPPKPQPRVTMADDAKKFLRSMLRWAKQSIELNPIQKAGVDVALAELGDE